jgi:electron transfer flavoprotein alpha/beta subunit
VSALVFVRPYPAWDKLRFDLSSGAAQAPPDAATGLSAFGEGTWTLNPSDRAALDALVGLGAADAGGVTAVALDAGDAEAAEAALREALARGATRALLITGAAEADSYVISSILAALAGREAAVDLVATGAEAPGGAPDEIAPMLAEALGWPALPAALTLAQDVDGAGLRAETRWGHGSRTLAAPLPAVVSVLPDPALEPRYPTPAATMAAFRAKQVTRVSVADLGLTGADAVDGAPRVIVRRAQLGEPPANERLSGQIEESVAVLLHALRQFE